IYWIDSANSEYIIGMIYIGANGKKYIQILETNDPGISLGISLGYLSINTTPGQGWGPVELLTKPLPAGAKVNDCFSQQS
ncbi:MAG TPA: hypothetical protein VK760_01415, partial [Candidatus Acidoferrales bacterium]|nr:hypothetical protein [Candidatus Acidoferrales bacterium]